MGSMGMAKGLTLFTMAVAAIIVLVFGLDLAATVPFGRPQGAILLDISFVICGLLLAYIGWTTFRELE